MLLKIEVFPPAGGNAKAAAFQTLYASPSTVFNRYGQTNAQDDDDDKTDDDATVDSQDKNHQSQSDNPNAGLVATIGRKGDVDILFGSDRSISRQHASLRFVAPKITAKSKKRTRGQKAATSEETTTNNTTANGGCFMEPRNKAEEIACKNSPYGMCLVLENKGKSGSYIASRDENHTTGDGNDASKEDSDATTDDEGPSSSAQNHSHFFGTATSLTTQLGQVIVSASQKSSSQKLPPLSEAIQSHFGNQTPIRLTKVDADELQVLEFESNNNNDNNKNNNSTNAVLIQFGCAQLPTIQITLIPMQVVFSSGVPTSIQDSLRLCGGLGQEAGSLPSKDDSESAGTTHLVTTERMAVAKQLMAWCYEIPIVSPDFLVALSKHSNLQDPFPHVRDYPAMANDTKNEFWDWTPNPKLLSRYIVLSVDPSLEIEQAEGLSRAAGAVVEELYDPKKKLTKAKMQTQLKRVQELLENDDNNDNSAKQLVLLTSKTKSKWANANSTNLMKQLEEGLSIPLVTTKMLAKTITKQVSTIVGLESSNETCSEKGRVKDGKTSDKSTNSSEIAAVPEKANAEKKEDPKSPEWQLRTTSERPKQKRQRQKTFEETKAATENDSNDKDDNVFDGKNNKLNEIPSRTSKRRRVDREDIVAEDQENDKDFILNADNDESMQVERTVLATINVDKKTTRQQINFDQPSNGWFQAAPKDDRERSRLRQRAAEKYEKATGIALEASASTGEPLSVEPEGPMKDATNQVHRHGYATVRQTIHGKNVPNFKLFRKNHVPRVDQEVVVLVDASLTAQTTQEASAEELELEENQRLAEALFSGESMPGMVQKRKRTRK